MERGWLLVPCLQLQNMVAYIIFIMIHIEQIMLIGIYRLISSKLIIFIYIIVET